MVVNMVSELGFFHLNDICSYRFEISKHGRCHASLSLDDKNVFLVPAYSLGAFCPCKTLLECLFSGIILVIEFHR